MLLPGAAESSSTAAAYCPLCVTKTGKGPRPPADAPVSCAVCHLKSNLETPPALSLPPHFFDVLAYALPSADAYVAVPAMAAIEHAGRAPPSA